MTVDKCISESITDRCMFNKERKIETVRQTETDKQRDIQTERDTERKKTETDLQTDRTD